MHNAAHTTLLCLIIKTLTTSSPNFSFRFLQYYFKFNRAANKSSDNDTNNGAATVNNNSSATNTYNINAAVLPPPTRIAGLPLSAATTAGGQK